MTNPRILLIEDTLSIAMLYKGYLAPEGFEIDHARDGAQARQLFATHEYASVLLDLGLPDEPGEDLLKHMLALRPGQRVVIVTANGSIQRVVACMREGAADYVVKPAQKERLITALTASASRKVEPAPPAPEAESQAVKSRFIGESPAMQTVLNRIRAVAPSKAAVFITGESGSGKEVCAETIHRLSPRGNKPFIAINCGAIPKDLMESEIFGHLKGSFTGAIADRDGAAMLAHGGTLFLDEICEMDMGLQTKLLRFLQTGLIQRVGSGHLQQVDVRIICATNRDPELEVRQGRFREDLFYRLHVVPILMPPLRERGGDVVHLARSFVSQFCAEEAKSFMGFTPDAETALIAHSWPGNVRELQNVLRRAIVFNSGNLIEAQMLDLPQMAASEGPADSYTRRPFPGARELWQIERDAIEDTIAACGGSVPRAAKMLGVSPSTIYRKRESWASGVQMTA